MICMMCICSVNYGIAFTRAVQVLTERGIPELPGHLER